jgi:hypothetical protein
MKGRVRDPSRRERGPGMHGGEGIRPSSALSTCEARFELSLSGRAEIQFLGELGTAHVSRAGLPNMRIARNLR